MISVYLAKRSAGLGGKLFGTLFFTVFAGFGIVFCAFMGQEVYKIAQTYTWKKTECLILDSKAVEDSKHAESPYSFRVKYQYTWQGKSFTSEQFSGKSKSFSDYTKVQRLVQTFKSDASNTCFVNPTNPSEAILQRDSLWFVLFGFIPLLFVFIGVGGIYAMWRVPEVTDPDANHGPVTDKARVGPFVGCFFLLFFLAGAAVAFHMCVQPIYRILMAQSWQSIPCKVEASRLQSHSSDDGTTYSIDILYAYEFNGQEYKSSRYDFLTGSSSGYKGKAAIVGRYPPGTKTTCYVNPKQPIEAVLNRGFRMEILWFGILFPIPFLAIGMGGFIYSLRKKQSGLPPSNRTRAQVQTQVNQILKSRGMRVSNFLGTILAAAFWNGIVSVFLFQVWQSWKHHHFQWGLALFMIPFVLIGLVLLGVVCHSFLALFNPKVIVKVNPPSPTLGELLDVHWQIQGNPGKIKHLRIYLEGREEVQYQDHSSGNSRNSKRTATRPSTFATFELANIDRAQLMASGHAQVKIPAETMPSFNAQHNKIIWSIHVKGYLPHWPDIKDEFPVTVLPLPLQQITS